MSINNLTEEEKNVLLMLSYYDLPTDKKLDGASIETIWSVAKLQADSSKDSFKAIEAYMGSKYKGSNLTSLTLSGYQNHNPNTGNNSEVDSNSGFVGYAFQDNSGNATAVYRGSEPLGDMGHLRTDWTSNFEASMGVEIKQQKEANEFLSKISFGRFW